MIISFPALFLLFLSTLALIFTEMRKPCRYFASKIFLNLSYEGKEPERIKCTLRFSYFSILTQSAWPHERDQSIKFRGFMRFSLHVTTRNRLHWNRTVSIVEFYQEYYQLLTSFFSVIDNLAILAVLIITSTRCLNERMNWPWECEKRIGNVKSYNKSMSTTFN